MEIGLESLSTKYIIITDENTQIGNGLSGYLLMFGIIRSKMNADNGSYIQTINQYFRFVF